VLLLSKKGMVPTTLAVAFSIERLKAPKLIHGSNGQIEIWLAPAPDALTPVDPMWFCRVARHFERMSVRLRL
jgi:hypothetical protein